MARQDKAHHLWYHVGSGNRYLIPLGEKANRRPKTIVVDQLVAAFRRATERFFDAIEKDAALEKIVWPRAERYYDEVRAHGEPGTDGSWVETIPTSFD